MELGMYSFVENTEVPGAGWLSTARRLDGKCEIRCLTLKKVIYYRYYQSKNKQ